MNLGELQKLVAGGESEHLEFKRSTGERTDAAKTVCAMLNGHGGFVLFGVSDQGEIVGQQIAATTRNHIANELRRIEPPAFPDFETITIDGNRAIMILRIPGEGGPYTFDGQPYMRHGAATMRMPQAKYEQKLLERMHATHRWENQPAHGFSIADLDLSEVTRTIDEAIRRNRLAEPGTRDSNELLRGLGLLSNEGALLNAAVVLFAKSDKLLPNYPQCLLKMARFKGIDKTEFTDNRQEHGNAFNLFQRAQRFLQDHLPVTGKVIPGIFERVDDPLYPLIALREAIANALCHRDYANPGGSVSIAIYDDRLEIANSGNLPFDLKPEDLYKEHKSLPWNPLVAQAFYRRGLIEMWGRGTLKIREICLNAKLPEPVITTPHGEVMIAFEIPEDSRKPKSRKESLKEGAIAAKLQIRADIRAFIIRKGSLEEKVIAALSEGPLSRSEIAAKLGHKSISAGLKKAINALLEHEIIAYTIPENPQSRFQKYQLANNKEKN